MDRLRFVLLACLAALACAASAFGAPSYGDEAPPAEVRDAVERLRPQRPGVVDIYALIVGGDGSEDVFLREARTVQGVLDARLGTAGRSLSLVNHRSQPRPAATLRSIEFALLGVAGRMDRAEDVLYVHLASHGGSNHVLSLKHPALELYGLDAKYLRALLERAMVRYRVVVVSACYSGGFIAPLATPETLILTAANVGRQSYGCGNDSQITEFSRALYLKALQQTRSLRAAGGLAIELVHTDERAARRAHSYPQMRSGFGIEERLRILDRQLAGR
jgi:hypothetical protein